VPAIQYQQRLDQLAASTAAVESRQSNSILLCAAALAVFAYLAVQALNRTSFPLWTIPLPLPLAYFFFRQYTRQQLEVNDLARCKEFYERGLLRLNDQWHGEGDEGAEYEQPGHLFANDLNLFGHASLFQRLSTARTEIGKRKLASYLQDRSPSISESLARQAAVQELQPLTRLREQIATLGLRYQQSEAATFDAWLARPIPEIPNWLRPLAAVLPFTGLQAALGVSLRPQVVEVIEASQRLSGELVLIRQGIALLAAQNFQSPKLQTLVNTVKTPNAVARLQRLELYLQILAERTKEWFYLLSVFFLAGTQTALAIEAWRAANRDEMPAWLNAWAEFEALNALACYAHESPQDVYPTFESATPAFSAQALAHPLLPRETAIPNHLALHQQQLPLLLISGSNMAGKSTLLRAIGVNCVLAAAGAPVRAHSLHTSLFSLAASLSIHDALSEGKSRFLAEVERLRDSLQLARSSPPVLFLIDEIFSGTNSSDRRIAAAAVIAELLRHQAIGAVSTHDLALTEIPNAANVHMRSRNGTDPLDFDYLLKPGVNTETNALAIARLAGVPL
jgi:hypothetical protein